MKVSALRPLSTLPLFKKPARFLLSLILPILIKRRTIILEIGVPGKLLHLVTTLAFTARLVGIVVLFQGDVFPS